MSLRAYAELEDLYSDNTLTASQGFTASAPQVVPFMRSTPMSYFGVPPPRTQTATHAPQSYDLDQPQVPSMQPSMHAYDLDQPQPHTQPVAREPHYAPPPLEPSAPNPAAFRDVHTYDYSYKDAEYVPTVVDPHQKLHWINQIDERMSLPDAKAGLNLIRANIGNEHNADTTNQKRAEDLLADLAKHIIETNNTDLLRLLEEQMQDMYRLGQCAQGRVTRLWQLIQTIR
jgi:hypothetical protein